MSCSERSRRPSRTFAIVVALFPLVAAPGDEPARRLTTDGTLKLGPVFFNNGAEVAFATHEVPNLVSIVCFKLSDGSRRRQHPTVVSHQFDPAFSPDGRYHAYARSSTSPQLVLVIQDTRDKKESIFKPRESRASARNPSFAPDGSRVVFSLSDIGGHQIVSVDAWGQDLKRLTSAAGMNAWPVYSPDGRKIAFGSSRSGDFEIYVMSPDGSDLHQLTHNPGFDARPAWSPDGKRIAFTSNRDGNYDIYVMEADGSHPRNLTAHPARDDHAAWHPDGQRLLFVSDRDGGSDLYIEKGPQAPVATEPRVLVRRGEPEAPFARLPSSPWKLPVGAARMSDRSARARHLTNGAERDDRSARP
jgi:TolB protein